MKLTFKPKEFNLRILPRLLEEIINLEDCTYELSLEKVKQKRSNNANAYMWELCDRIAEAVSAGQKAPITKDDVYKAAIKEVGVFRPVEVNIKAKGTAVEAWSRIGKGWVAEVVYESDKSALINWYYGSSVYDSKQMSRLIDYIVDEAQNLGIETRTPQELALLKEEWDEKRQK